MGVSSSVLDTCLIRDRSRSCCDLDQGSLFGEDAFYRDAFYDCEEGNRSHDAHFAKAREQAWLKMRKGSMLANYATFELKRKASVAPVADALKVCGQPRDALKNAEDLARTMVRSPSKLRDSDDSRLPWWIGNTIEEWTSTELPDTGAGPYWSKGKGQDLKVRCGPNYRKTGTKTDSNGAMYHALSCDAIKDMGKVENIIGGIMKGKLPKQPSNCGESECAGGNALQWSKDCPLPRVICINMMLPFSAGLFGGRGDGGCSFVGLFHITPETIKAMKSPSPPPAVRLFKDFWDGPAGHPASDQKDPDRCLIKRVNTKVKKDQQAGLFKAIAHCVNPEDVNVPDMFHTYNGKPCLITKCGYVIKDPNHEWLEIGIDVRGFNILARKMLCSFRQCLPQTKIHYGFLVQGIEDEDMPEALLCDMYVHGINMLVDPVSISGEGPPAVAAAGAEETPTADRSFSASSTA